MFTRLKLFLPAILLSTSIATVAHAESTQNIEFKVITGYGSSTAILNGNYQAAVELAKARRDNQTPYDRAVNANSLCVAYAKMADVEQAINACSAAVRVSRRVGEATGLDRIALNNRKIVREFADRSVRR